MNLSIRSFALCLALLLALPLWSQTEGGAAPVSELQRRFMQMEQRALELSQRLSEMSGTEPIELIDRNESLEPILLEPDIQQSYDELPGPLVEPLPIPEEEPVEEVPTVYQSEVVRVVPTTQQRKGDFYLMPVLGFSISSYIAYEFNEGGINFSDDLDGGWGNSIGIMLGKRWDNWTMFCKLGYQYQKYDNGKFISQVPNTFADAEVTNESYLINFGGGYSIPLSNKLSTYGNAGMGFAYRKDSFDAQLYRIINNNRVDLNPRSDFESSLVFTYDFSMGLEYLFTQNYSARLGYRLLGLTSNESFDGSFQHLIELGVGANF